MNNICKLTMILMDLSGSMNTGGPEPARSRKEWAKSMAIRLCRNSGKAGQFSAGYFASRIHLLPEGTSIDPVFTSGEELAGILERDSLGMDSPVQGKVSLLSLLTALKLGSHTALYDCAAEAAAMLSSVGAGKMEDIGLELIVITDGEDSGSTRVKGWDALDALVRDLSPPVRLRIVPVPGTTLEGSTPSSSNSLPASVWKGDNISIDYDPEALFRSSPGRKTSQWMAVPLVNLDKRLDRRVVQRIRAEVETAAPWLERLTGLHYRPVPTVIVEESSTIGREERTRNAGKPIRNCQSAPKNDTGSASKIDTEDEVVGGIFHDNGRYGLAVLMAV